MLRLKCDVFRNGFRMLDNVYPKQLNASSCWTGYSSNLVDQCRFSCTVWSQKPKDLSLLDGECQSVACCLGRKSIDFCQILTVIHYSHGFLFYQASRVSDAWGKGSPRHAL